MILIELLWGRAWALYRLVPSPLRHYHIHIVSTWCHWRDEWDQAFPVFRVLFRLRVLYWMQTEERKRERPGNEARNKVWIASTEAAAPPVVYISTSLLFCSINMYLTTENEDPPPNVPLSGPPHLLSKSLTKVIILLASSMHNHFFGTGNTNDSSCAPL